MKSVNLTFVFPTLSECKDIKKETVAFNYHFILGDKQCCIQYFCNKFRVMAFNFQSNLDYKNNYKSHCDGWYTVGIYSDFSSAKDLYISVVVEIINKYGSSSVVPF